MQTLDRLRALAAAELSVDGTALDPETPLTSLHIDSLSFIDFVLTVEREFGIRVPDQRMNSILTIGDLERVVLELLAAVPEG